MKKFLLFVAIIIIIVVIFVLAGDSKDVVPEIDNEVMVLEETEDASEVTSGMPVPGTNTEEMIVMEEGVEPIAITVIANKTSFTPNIINAKVGVPVKLRIDADGFHTFTIDELGVNEIISNGITEIEFTPDKAGTFEFYCTVGNHRQAGQFGTIVIE